jgi:uncharacterized protein YuzE
VQKTKLDEWELEKHRHGLVSIRIHRPNLDPKLIIDNNEDEQIITIEIPSRQDHLHCRIEHNPFVMFVKESCSPIPQGKEPS